MKIQASKIKLPTSEEEAILLCSHLAEQFKFQCILIQKSDFENLMGTENWTDKEYKNAMELAAEEIANQAGNAIQNAVEEVNS